MEKLTQLQRNCVKNADDFQTCLLDLANWEKEMKRKEKELQDTRLDGAKNKITSTQVERSCNAKQTRYEEQPSTSKIEDISKQKETVVREDLAQSVSMTSKKHIVQNKKDDKMLDSFKQKQEAAVMKESGNKYFKNGDYTRAVMCYSSALSLDPENAILPANRAMAYVKLGQMEQAEQDCTLSISIDPTYAKAYFRRGTARVDLMNYIGAREDFLKVHELEPKNKQVIQELEALQIIFGGACSRKQDNNTTDEPLLREKHSKDILRISADYSDNFTSEKVSTMEPKYLDTCVIEPIEKPLHKRSMKPLKQVKVKDVSQSSQVLKDVCQSVKVPKFCHPANEECTEHTEIASSQAHKSANTNPVRILFPEVQDVPDRAYKFVRDWKKIKDFPDLQYKYLKNFPAEKFEVLFKHAMEIDLMSGIIQTLKDLFIKAGEDVYPYLKSLSNVGRFSILVMLLSKDDKSALRILINYIDSLGNYTKEDTMCLSKLYGL